MARALEEELIIWLQEEEVAGEWVRQRVLRAAKGIHIYLGIPVDEAPTWAPLMEAIKAKSEEGAQVLAELERHVAVWLQWVRRTPLLDEADAPRVERR